MEWAESMLMSPHRWLLTISGAETLAIVRAALGATPSTRERSFSTLRENARFAAREDTDVCVIMAIGCMPMRPRVV